MRLFLFVVFLCWSLNLQANDSVDEMVEQMLSCLNAQNQRDCLTPYGEKLAMQNKVIDSRVASRARVALEARDEDIKRLAVREKNLVKEIRLIRGRQISALKDMYGGDSLFAKKIELESELFEVTTHLKNTETKLKECQSR